MTAPDILALPPGPALDNAVHIYVFGGEGAPAPYSTNDATGLKILDRMPLFIAKCDSAHPKFDASRPWIAGTLAHEPTLSGDVTRMRVAAPTRLVALCKAALLVIFKPAKVVRTGPGAQDREIRPDVASSSEAAAKAVAARIGTPGARSPAAGIAAANAAAQKRADAKAKADAKAAKKAARMGQNGQRGAIPAAPASVQHTAPVARPAGRPQPGIFTHQHNRPPMPTRAREFVAPQPIDTGGNEKTGARG